MTLPLPSLLSLLCVDDYDDDDKDQGDVNDYNTPIPDQFFSESVKFDVDMTSPLQADKTPVLQPRGIGLELNNEDDDYCEPFEVLDPQ